MFELRSSAMFSIDDQAAFAEQDKLELISSALRAEREFDDRYEAGAGEVPSMQHYGSSQRPFIRVSRGSEFVDPSSWTISLRRSLVAFLTAVADHGWRTETAKETPPIRYCGI